VEFYLIVITERRTGRLASVHLPAVKKGGGTATCNAARGCDGIFPSFFKQMANCKWQIANGKSTQQIMH
jgi:hypothetical protein